MTTAIKVTRVSDEHLHLARQPSHTNDHLSIAPDSSDPVYADEELVRRAQNDDSWAIEQLVLRYQKKGVLTEISTVATLRFLENPDG